MADPKTAFTENPYAECEVRIEYSGRVATCSAASPTSRTRSRARSSPRATTSSSIAGKGTIRVGDEEWEVDGFGLRDHSWGPRYWQAPWYYRWLTANFGADFGFMGSRVARRDGEGTRGGFVWEDGQLHLCHDFEIAHRLAGRGHLPPGHLGHAAIRRDKEWKVTGKVLDLIPLRNRRPDPTRRHARHPHLRGHDRVDARRRSHRLRPVASTSTRSSTATPSGWRSSQAAVLAWLSRWAQLKTPFDIVLRSSAARWPNTSARTVCTPASSGAA